MRHMIHNTDLLITTERERWLKLHMESGLSITALSSQSGFSRDTLHRWRRRYLSQGLEGLREYSRAPHSHPHITSADIVSRIREIRSRYHFCAQKIQIRLAKQGIHMSVRGIHKVLKREGLVSTKRRIPRTDIWRPKSIIPGELVEIDVALMRKYQGNWLYQFTAIDSCTRWRHLKLYTEQHTHNAVRFLESVIERAPFRIQGVKTDNGSIFTNRYVGTYRRHGMGNVHAFDRYCRDHRIIHYLIDPGKPAQNGKVERSHRTDREEFWNQITFHSLKEMERKQNQYVRWYNTQREHLGIGGLTPMEKLQKCQI
jgi:transposase InsO family protein